MLPAVVGLVFIALIFNFLNGIHDSSNIVATVISSHALSPRLALLLTAIAEFLGPFLFGVAVAKTIGDDIVTPGTVTLVVIYAAVSAAIVWNLLTWYFGIPSSSSHALIGGILGAVAIDKGFDAIRVAGLEKVLIALFTSPLIGLAMGYLLMKLIYFLVRGASPKVNELFKRVQAFTLLSLALSHGANDAQKTIGIITLALVTAGFLPSFMVPFWVISLSGIAMAFGTGIGGWRLIRTLGGKFYRIRPVHGFASQFASASVILSASLFGGPVSTTQVVSSVILGTGVAQRLSMVRWMVVSDIITAWLITIPSTALLAVIFKILFSYIFVG